MDSFIRKREREWGLPARGTLIYACLTDRAVQRKGERESRAHSCVFRAIYLGKLVVAPIVALVPRFSPSIRLRGCVAYTG